MILITNQKSGQTYKMKAIANIDSNNKDFLFWAQSQSDLSTLSDGNKLRKTGALIRDPITGALTRNLFPP